jgi:hypothetical protein
MALLSRLRNASMGALYAEDGCACVPAVQTIAITAMVMEKKKAGVAQG